MSAHVEEALAAIRQAVEAGPRPVFSTSMGVEDQVLAHLIFSNRFPVEVFTLDTGRLHPETHQLIADSELFFRRRIRVLSPEREAVESYVQINGINGFYESLTQRKQCCDVRKIQVLERALAGKTAWVTGLRREQSPTREGLGITEFDAQHNLLKVNPLLNWSTAQVWDYVAEHDVPVSPLHAQGYPSIGCAPCTRAIQPGESIRAGRWWWESAEHKECGLHVKQEVSPVQFVSIGS
ncbi:MAG: phosphoadenylyl-sulfate reductase [Lautropia sp.]|nr:phosphoadenylyl-sulfate reductase [Lautropia sp.]